MLGHPRSTRCTARRWTSTTNSTYSRVSPMVSTVKKSVAAGRWPGRVGLRPARPAPPRCGSDPVATQDPSYRGRRHPNAEVAALPRRPSGNPSGGSPAPAVPPGRRPVRPDRAGHDRSADRSTGGRLAPGATAARSRALLGMPPTARAATSSLTPLAASDPQGVPRTRYLAAQHRQLMPKYGDLHAVMPSPTIGPCRGRCRPARSSRAAAASAFGVGPQPSTPRTCRTIIKAIV